MLQFSIKSKMGNSGAMFNLRTITERTLDINQIFTYSLKSISTYSTKQNYQV